MMLETRRLGAKVLELMKLVMPDLRIESGDRF